MKQSKARRRNLAEQRLILDCRAGHKEKKTGGSEEVSKSGAD
jgi:hypothetical protein